MKSNKLTIVLFVIYLIVLVWILLFKLGVQFSYMEERRFSLIPFSALFATHRRLNLSEIISNVIIFIPLGVYAGVLFKRWAFGKKLFSVFFISLLIEAFQFIFRIGAFDITDIIANTLGGLFGLLLFIGIEKLFSNSAKAQKFINIIGNIGTVLIISFLVLLKLNMLPIRYQ
ncbi:MAG: VanZ family protein [Chitinophagaceae bacterium]